MKSSQMQGVWTALVTPFQKDGAIDWPAFDRLVDFQIQGGIHGIVISGTTGESPTLTTQEKHKLVTRAIEKTKDTQTKLMVGTGSNNTLDTIEFSKWAEQAGAQGLLVVAPYYNKPQQSGLLSHFGKTASAVKCEIMLYNVPGRSGINIEPKTMAELGLFANINTVKEASGRVQAVTEIREAVANIKGSKLDVLSGDDVTFLPLMAL